MIAGAGNIRPCLAGLQYASYFLGGGRDTFLTGSESRRAGENAGNAVVEMDSRVVGGLVLRGLFRQRGFIFGVEDA